MAAIEPNVQGLIVFLTAWLTGCVGFFFLSGSLPLRAAPQQVQSGIGLVLVWLNLAVFAVLVLVTLGFAVMALRWTSLVVGGGFAFLFAPFIVQDLPVALKDTRAGLGALLIAGLMATGLVVMAGW